MRADASKKGRAEAGNIFLDILYLTKYKIAKSGFGNTLSINSI